MTFKLNWKFKKTLTVNHIKLYASLLIICISFNFNAKAQQSKIFLEDDHSRLGSIDTIVAKTNKITIDDEDLPVYSFSVGKVGGVFPCGTQFGISLQAPGYHIFSAESAFNATYMPNGEEIQWPDEGPEKNAQVYQNTFKRIKAMKVGTVAGSFGKRWTLSAEQFRANYGNLFDFELDGQKKLAGDYSNMFFEMLISIQQLANENDELKSKLADTESRLANIEAKLNLADDSLIVDESLINELKVSPNPSDNGMLNIEYSINEKVRNAIFYIFDLNARTLYKTTIIDRGIGNISQSFDLATGVYFYQLATDGNKGETVKLIIN